eukprot:maker-scaffold177_size283923-snap-gene-1.31 protein:Tk02065 transcript:maker-scaffold177_size283923-snap-gene-1.31-mRNA-1 annotation:"galactoside 2-alpha-l-fucosyltransferase 2-like"
MFQDFLNNTGSSQGQMQNAHSNRIQDLKTIPEDYLDWVAKNKTLQIKNTQGCHHLMTVADSGRLGNQMCQYITLFEAARRYGFQGVITEQMAQILRPKFPYLSLISMSQTQCQHAPWTNVTLEILLTIPTKAALLDRGHNIRILGFPCAMEWFEANYAQVFREFSFGSDLLKVVENYYTFVKDDYRRKMGLAANTSIEVISVHNRRTDYKSHLQYWYQGLLVTKAYFDRAMDLQKRSWGNQTLFVMASDDPKWLLRQFRDRDDVYFTSRSPYQFADTVAFDMAILSHADHSIFSFGTYGFWSAYLTGGDVIMATNYSDILQPLTIDAQAVLRKWTYISDPCLNGGKLKKECSNIPKLYHSLLSDAA